MGLLGYFISNRSIFLFVAGCALPTILTLFLISPDEIDYGRARGAKEGGENGKQLERAPCSRIGRCSFFSPAP